MASPGPPNPHPRPDPNQKNSTPHPSTTTIRSLKDQDSIYKAFDAYPWTKDPAFLSGLHAILGPPSSSSSPSLSSLSSSSRDIATHARIFYYAQRIGVSIDFSSYHSWLAQHPDHHAPDILPAAFYRSPEDKDKDKDNSSSNNHNNNNDLGLSSGSPPPALAWQQAAPRAQLYIDRSPDPHSQPHPQPQSSAHPGAGEPSYPMAFADMIKLIQEGKPVPGIRQIPNTIERDSTVTPIGSRLVPRKPWERGAPAGELPSSLDLEFPPVDEDT